MSRRAWIETGGLALAGLFAIGRLTRLVAMTPRRVVEIAMRSDASGGAVWFEPAGVHLIPGQTVRWVVRDNVHTTTAYHPHNDGHQLRIPADAAPWDSGYLVKPGESFEVTFSVPGIYDYFCRPHEAFGMVGRIVVGWPTAAPAPFAPSVPEAARHAFPSVDAILKQKAGV